jgi:hypothetical protein
MNNNIPLSPRLVALWKQSYLEAGFCESEIPDPDEKPRICLYPKSYIQQVIELTSEKIYDFNFRGALYIDEKTRGNRQWIVDFAKQRFTADSFFQITDGNAKRRNWLFKTRHKVLGGFDHTFSRSGFVPKENPRDKRGYFDEDYFKVLCQSKFTLCPAGDAPWSMRFYESLLSKSIPIVEKVQHTGRNDLEYSIGYRYYLVSDDKKLYRPDWVEDNFKKFIRFQTLINDEIV